MTMNLTIKQSTSFKFSNQEFLLGYMYEDDELILTLLKLGVHENFYRDIRNEV